MIEWRVWDWSKYADRDPYLAENPYSMELCIMVHLGDGATARMTYPDGLSITQAEELAKDFYELIKSKNKQPCK